MEDQRNRIAGYRELEPAEVKLINEIKAFEAGFNGLIDRLKVAQGIDARLVSIAATHGETAFMFAVKAVAQPERRVA